MLSAMNSSQRVIFWRRELIFWLSVKNSSPRVFSSTRIIFFTLGEELFAESPRFGSHQRVLLSAKALFPVVNIHSAPATGIE
jgi:hypothetical protein